MPISVGCDSCSHQFSVSSKLAGKRVKCPVCSEPVRVTVDDDDEPVKPQRSSGGRTSKGRKRKPEGQNGLMLGLGIGAGGVAILAIAFVLMTRGGGGNGPVPAGSPQTAQGSAVPVNPSSVVSAPASTQPVVPTVVYVAEAPAATNAAPTNPPANKTEPATSTVAAKVPIPPSSPVPASTPTAATLPESAPLIEMSMTDLVAKIEKSVVRITVNAEEGSSVGSGFVIDSDGSIMTNYHVIECAKSAVVEFDTGKKFDVIGFTALDMERDLAIIKIKFDSTPPQKVSVAGELPKKGEKVAAFGAPRNLSFTASDGIISAIRHCPDPEFKARTAGCYLQTTAPISPGNSGGPLVNMRGEVVGVNSFKMQGENLNFAASATDIREVIGLRKDAVVPLSPEALPQKYTDKFSQAENLAGTTRGNLLLSQIRDAIILVLPFAYDPTGRVSEYVEIQVEKHLVKKAGWTKVKRQSQVKASTAVVVVLIYFQVAENVEKADEKMISELMCRVRVVTRDVDKDGHAHTAIVWDEDGALGTIAIGALYNGIVPDAMRGKIASFFNKIVTAQRKAQQSVEGGK